MACYVGLVCSARSTPKSRRFLVEFLPLLGASSGDDAWRVSGGAAMLANIAIASGTVIVVVNLLFVAFMFYRGNQRVRL